MAAFPVANDELDSEFNSEFSSEFSSEFRVVGGTPPPLAAVLFDRDGTLVHDVPYNGDPDLVRPVDGAAGVLARLRAAGLATGIVTNQSGVAMGRLQPGQVEAVNRRVGELLGPFDVIVWCPHGPGDGCRCRKPEPGMIQAAAAALGVTVERCAMIGDTGADVGAALAAGARPVLVPNGMTRAEEIEQAPTVVGDLAQAIDHLFPPWRRS